MSLLYSSYSRLFLQVGINFPLLGISFHLLEKYSLRLTHDERGQERVEGGDSEHQ